jgi:flavin reductase (DIM6/NTAB) family NADH-FMN oxidoreductase RutF
MPVDGPSLRQAMRRWATGVTVVTTATPLGLHGITVNSFTSLSLDPPLCLICIDRRTRAHEEIPRAGAFTVNILGEGDEEIAARFAGRRPELADPFVGLEWTKGPLGAPRFRGAAAFLDCALDAQLPGGDHTIFVGRVEHAEGGAAEVRPLLFYGGAFRRVAEG